MNRSFGPILLLCTFIIISTQTGAGQGKAKMINLDFTEQDFYSKDGEYLYEMEDEKLPWLNSYDLLTNLKKIKQLVYSYSKLTDAKKKFENTTLKSDIKVIEEEDLVSIDYIFYGYDRYNLPEDADLPPNDINIDNNYNLLYPLHDGSFRVIGEENIETEAGSFDCTVLEVISEFGQLQKLWMVNNMSGVYARVIDSKPGDLGHYLVFELKEIVRK